MALRYLFVDMNSYFASVEQQEQPHLRGRPVGVIPADAETTCCIAASYEAKARGVKTGTGVREARQLCPDIQLPLARPKLYVEYHHRIIAAVESCLHVERVCSIDEMYARLYRNEREPETAAAIAHQIKAAIAESVGPWVRCSIGIAPNVWLAKVATDLQKPDGLAMILPEQLPEKIAHLELTDLPGIARGMSRRLSAHGVYSVADLYAQSETRLKQITGSRVWAQTWFGQLRGIDLPYRPTQRRTIGHSHVLPPNLRTDRDAYAVVIRMVHKAAARLRRLGYWANHLWVRVKHWDHRVWQRRVELGQTRSTLIMVAAVRQVWAEKPPGIPSHVSVVLTDLTAHRSAALPLYPQQQQQDDLACAMDRIEARYGTNRVFSGAMLGYEQAAPVRISFTQIPQLEEFWATPQE